MAKRYCSFLVRCWHLDDDAQRFEIEHIQSGSRVQVGTVAAAVDWISAHDSAEARMAPADEAPGTRAPAACGEY